jgi:hypothetical protein
MEVFSSGSGPAALLVHHAEDAGREIFANWLQRNSGKQIFCGRPGKTPITARIHRVSLCFGRGLILLRGPAFGLRAKDVLSIITG